MSDIHRFLGPVQWKTEKTSEWTIATIISDDVLILPHRANPVGWNFREPQDDKTREWSKRFFAKHNSMPTMWQAGV